MSDDDRDAIVDIGKELERVAQSGVRYYDRDGNPMELFEWAEKYEDPSYKIVKQTLFSGVGGEILLSTVWLGLDHSHGMGGPPILFETMCFGLPGDEEFQYRYATEEQALLGHARCEDVLLRKFLQIGETVDGMMVLDEGVRKKDDDTCE